jgi:hypothetical protein
LSVKKDLSSGQVIGWDDFFNYIDQQEAFRGRSLSDVKAMQKELDTKVKLFQASFTIDGHFENKVIIK